MKFKQKTKNLKEREKQLRLALEDGGDELTKKLKTVGKIALISGLVALVGFWIYKAFFSEQKEAEEPKKGRSNFANRISVLATPYIVKFFKDMFETEGDTEDDEKTKENTKGAD